MPDPQKVSILVHLSRGLLVKLFARRETKMKVNVPFTLLAPSPKFIIELGPATQMLPTALLQSYNIWW